MNTTILTHGNTEFMTYLQAWYDSLETFSLKNEVDNPSRLGVFAADMIVGFCSEGPLASPRITDIVPVVVDIFKRTHEFGAKRFVLCQDSHSDDAEEFLSFPRHCIRGSKESLTIPQLTQLPFSNEFVVIEKNSLHPSLGNEFEDWMDQNSELRDLVVVGDCTDLCTYSVAMYLRLRSNALNLRQRVILPVDAVQTYDLPIESARSVGALAHPGDFFHLTFLYHMALNGIHVVKSVV